MKIYSRYIIQNLLGPVVFVTLTLTSAIWLIQALQYVSYIVNRGLPARDFLAMVVLLLPSVIGLILPIACLCATIFIYNRLTYDSEILVMKAAGISRFGTAKPAILLFMLVICVGYSISLYLLPVSYRMFKTQQVELRDNFAALMLEEGVFNSPVENIAIYAGEREKDGSLKGILVHDSRNKGRPVTWMAKSGRIVKVGNSVRFVLEHASSQQVNRATGEVRILYFDSYPFDISIYAGGGGSRTLKKDERFLGELFNPTDKVTTSDRARFFAEGHERIIWPLYNLVLPLVAIGLMLSGDFNRRGQSKRILAVVAICITIIVLGFATKNIVARGNAHLAFIMYLPSICGLLFAFYSLLSTRRLNYFGRVRFRKDEP